MAHDRRTSGASARELASHPWKFECDRQGCFYVVCADSEREAEFERYAHACPRKGGPMGPSVIQQAWAQLDDEVDEIMKLTPVVEAEKRLGGYEATPAVWARRRGLAEMKARARGKSEILALIMSPIFTTADEISAEAGQRYAARLMGLTRQTPGTDPATAAHDLRDALERRQS